MPESQYQTVPLPDGSVQAGLFPTIEWFQEIAQHVDFRDTRVLDLGCCQFSYGIQALQSGACFVAGVDHDSTRTRQSNENIRLWKFERQCSVRNVDALDYIESIYLDFDVVIVGMLLHWLVESQAKALLKGSWRNADRALVVIYRLPTADGTGFCPVSGDLDLILDAKGYHQMLMDTETQRIGLAVYKR
jgi:16S rRNA G966 N2-methylase RsmD